MFNWIKRLRKTQPPHNGKVFELHVGGWLGKYMWTHNWGGQTIPFPFFTLMVFWTMQPQPDGNVDPLTRVHEWVHVHQNNVNRFFFVSWIRYSWDDWKHFSFKTWRAKGFSAACMEAYWANKFEKEAYAVEDLARANGLPDWAK
jgi:hypothetical protein